MRILQVNALDAGGGAAEVALNLLLAYRQRGHHSWLVVGQKRTADPDVVRLPNRDLGSVWTRFWWDVHARLQASDESAPRIAPLRQVARGLARSLAEPRRALDYYRGVEDFGYPATRHLLRLTPQTPDVVHGHNLHSGYFDLRVLPGLSRQVPLILTLHDAWLLSGHCAHSFTCERWRTGCGHCPDLTIPPAVRRDATALNWRRKQDLYRHSRVYVATPCRWLMRKVERSMLAPGVADARVVPNGVDLSIFKPADARAARARLGLPLEARVLLWAAHRAQSNVWKDHSTVWQAVARVSECLPDSQVVLVVLGDEATSDGQPGQAGVHFVPFLSDRAVVATYFQAADLYVHAAHVETFPQTVLEALACGTPVVATSVGGIPEQVDDGRTGFLVPPGDVRAMAGRIGYALAEDDVRARLMSQAVDTVRQRFDYRRQVDAYLNWYTELIEARRGARA